MSIFFAIRKQFLFFLTGFIFFLFGNYFLDNQHFLSAQEIVIDNISVSDIDGNTKSIFDPGEEGVVTVDFALTSSKDEVVVSKGGVKGENSNSGDWNVKLSRQKDVFPNGNNSISKNFIVNPKAKPGTEAFVSVSLGVRFKKSTNKSDGTTFNISGSLPNPTDSPVETITPRPGLTPFPTPLEQGLILSPQNDKMVSNDAKLFTVSGGEEDETLWVFSVDGVEGGNSSAGLIEASPAAPFIAIYTAPDVNREETVTLRAVDPDDKTRVATTKVTIFPLSGDFMIKPDPATVPIGKTVVFQAGILLEDDSFIPLNNVFWSVNGLRPGDDIVGSINDLGIYRAPFTMPEDLPITIEIEFSFSPGGIIEDAVLVTLAELVVTPDTISSIQAGPMGALSASLFKSDNSSIIPVPVSDLTFTSSRSTVAEVDANGNITDVGDEEIGRSVIDVVHSSSGASDTSVAIVRSDIKLVADVVRRTADFARIKRPTFENGVEIAPEDQTVTEIEFTRPGAIFNFIPTATFLRGPNANSSITANNNPHLTITADGTNIEVYDEEAGESEPDLSDKVAVVEKSTGFVVIGNKPGEGTISAIYDDGFGPYEVSLKVIYTQVDLTIADVNKNPINNGDINEVLISHPFTLHLFVSNPTPDSDFVGNTPIRVTLIGDNGEEEPFDVSFGLDNNGNNIAITNPPSFLFESDLNAYNKSTDSSELLLSLISNSSEFANDRLPVSRTAIRIIPKRSGIHKFQFEVMNDPGVPVKVVEIDVKKPKLIATEIVPVNSCININIDSSSGLPNLGRLKVTDQDQAIWSWTKPDMSVTQLPDFSFGNSITLLVRQTGDHIIRLSIKDKPEFSFDDFKFEVVTGDTVVDAEIEGQTESFGDNSVDISPDNQIASFEIIKPFEGKWVKGVPVDIVIQTYSANGVPKSIGRSTKTKVIREGLDDTIETTETVKHEVYGIRINRSSDDYIIDPDNDTLHPVDGSGLISFRIIPTSDDPTVEITSSIVTSLYRPNGMNGIPILEIIDDFRNPSRVYNNTEAAAFAEVDFVDSSNRVYLSQTLKIKGNGGKGLAFEPFMIPVASKRFRDAVENNLLPDASLDVTFRAFGSEEFADALEEGLRSADLGDGLSLVSSTNDLENRKLVITASTNLESFESITDDNGQSALSDLYGKRTIKLTFNDDSVWEGDIFLFGMELIATPGGHSTVFAVERPDPVNPKDLSDKNIPLNGRNRARESEFANGAVTLSAKGSQSFSIFTKSPDLRHVGVDLELMPTLDFGDTFRGVPAQQLIGFKRNVLYGGENDDEVSGIPSVLKIKSLPITFTNKTDFDFFANTVTVFGNTTDRRTLDPRTFQLGPVGDPDGYPDFVSKTANSEKLIASLDGNVADVRFFTVYNLKATVEKDLVDPELNFDEIKDSIVDTYKKYSTSFGTETVLTVANLEKGKSIEVFVDHEATTKDLFSRQNILASSIPESYFGGVLDQNYLWLGSNPNTGLSIGNNRMNSFDGDRGEDPFRANNATGSDHRIRKSFGLELDGVLFDPSFNIVTTDEDPNSSELLGIPVVSEVFNFQPQLTANELLPDIGGSSGGYYDLDHETPGSYFVVSKTPAHEFPGIHGGYLIKGKVSDLIDIFTETTEDDISDVLIKRDPAEGQSPEGLPIVQESDSSIIRGRPQARWVMTYSRREDKKSLIATGIKSSFKYKMITDPQLDMEPVKFRAGLLLRELPAELDAAPDLLVTTQSDGSEALNKAIIDTLSDLAIDIIAGSILNMVTGGGSTALCGISGVGDAISDVVLGLADFPVNLIDAEFYEPLASDKVRNRIRSTNNVLQDGVTAANFGLGPVQVDVFSLINPGDLTLETIKDKKAVANHIKKSVSKLAICSILNAPFEALKDKIKGSFTVEDSGGNGAAEAIGIKSLGVNIPVDAQKGEGGVYILNTTVSRVIDILPSGSDVRNLEDLSDEFNKDSALVSDINLIKELKAASTDQTTKRGRDALKILRLIGRTSVVRESEIRDNIYRDYKLRAWSMPSVEMVISPGGNIGEGLVIGDFELTSGQTEIPVSFTSTVKASRSNQNAGARAAIQSNGYEMRVLKAMISPPEIE